MEKFSNINKQGHYSVLESIIVLKKVLINAYHQRDNRNLFYRPILTRSQTVTVKRYVMSQSFCQRFFLRNGGSLVVKINWSKPYLLDLEEEDRDVASWYTFMRCNSALNIELKTLVNRTMEETCEQCLVIWLEENF